MSELSSSKENYPCQKKKPRKKERKKDRELASKLGLQGERERERCSNYTRSKIYRERRERAGLFAATTASATLVVV